MPQLYTIAQPSSVDIKRALDIGPCEALVPNVRNANEAHHGVDAADTVPKGIAAEDEEDEDEEDEDIQRKKFVKPDSDSFNFQLNQRFYA